MDKLDNKLLDLYDKVIDNYGRYAQKMMLIEECGQLLNVIAKYGRGRSTIDDIITELADVHIMVEQMAAIYGWDSFQEEKERKLQRLKERLET